MLNFAYNNPWKASAIVYIVLTVAVLYKSGKLLQLTRGGYDGFDGKTTGSVLSVKPISKQISGRFGTRFQIEKFAVRYMYKVASVEYTRTDSVYNTAENLGLIGKLVLPDADKTIEVRYDVKNPTVSYVKE